MREKSAKESIWAEFSKFTSKSPAQCHDYFHNTWVLQFYDSFKDLRPELREILNEAERAGAANPAEQAKNLLIQRHPEKNLYPHSLLQAAYVMMRRPRRPEAPRKREVEKKGLTSGDVDQLRRIVYGWTEDELRRIL